MSEITIHPTFTQSDSTYSFFAYDPYIETFWLPALGPTASLLINELSLRALISKDTQIISTRGLSQKIGVGARAGRSSPINKQLTRLVNAGIVQHIAENEYMVPRSIKPLSKYMLGRLNSDLVLEHDSWICRLSISPLSTQRRRAKALTSRLEIMGLNQSTIREILSSSGLHPSVIGELIRSNISPHLSAVANI